MRILTILFIHFVTPSILFTEADIIDYKVVNVRADKSGKGYVAFDKQLGGTLVMGIYLQVTKPSA